MIPKRIFTESLARRFRTSTLNEFFPDLLKFDSIEEMEKSAVYQKIKPKSSEF
jgi:hypothetical protein